MKKLIILLSLLATLCACSNEQKPTTDAPITSNKPVFRFDFSKDQKIVYDFKQRQVMRQVQLPAKEKDYLDTTHIWLEGKVMIDIKKEEQMNLIMDQMTANSFYTGPNKSRDTFSSPFPQQFIQGFDAFAKNSLDPNNNTTFMEFFPLPYGEPMGQNKYELPANMPLQAPTALLNVTGTRKINLVESLEYKNRKCYKIECETVIDQVQLPPAAKNSGTYICEMKSNFWGYYDYENHYYIEGHNKVSSKILLHSELPVKTGGTKTSGIDIINMQEIDYFLSK